jgi:hypothetical protein
MMASCPDDSSLQHQTEARYFNSVGFGINVYLRCHIDQDFTMSIVQVHVETLYHFNDDIVCYCCFPRIGVAVALHPGDFLMFNPQEPHSISSRCNPVQKLYCLLSYLKTPVVGLNNNSNYVI